MSIYSRTIFIGCDIETTGLEPYSHEIIQLGLAMLTPNKELRTFVSDVGHASYQWESKALEINKFTHERIKAGPPITEVEAKATKWVWDNCSLSRMDNVAVGWNVETFDLQFLKRHMPKLAMAFSYRAVNLNSICFAMGDYDTWRKLLKKESIKRMGSNNIHDALWDATAGLYALEFVRQWTKNIGVEVP